MCVRLLSAACAFACRACADPQPGDVFREFTYAIRFSELDPVFRFTAGQQACYGFDWGFYRVYGFTVRLYYDGSIPHLSGELLIAPGSVIADNPKLTARIKPSDAPIGHGEGLTDSGSWSIKPRNRVAPVLTS
jgi:hypothetical protein